MKIISIICMSLLLSGVFAHGEEKAEKAEEHIEAQANDGRVEIAYSFPSSFTADEMKKYVSVIRKRLELLSRHQVTVNQNKDQTVFRFMKGDLTDDDIAVLHGELLANFRLSLYEVLANRDAKGISGIVLKPIFLQESEVPVLVACYPKPFLTLGLADISEIHFPAEQVDKEDAAMRIELKKKSDVLEEKTGEAALTNRQIYFEVNDGLCAKAPLVFQKISNRMAITLDDAFAAKILQMQYQYPLPELKR